MLKYDNRRDILKPFEENREYMDMRVKTGIEQYRKGYGSIRLLDGEGRPVKGARLELKQKTHDFLHGANIFMLDEMETPEKNEGYKQMFAESFNLATVPFYWRDLEPEQGRPRYARDSYKIYRRPAPQLCVDFCRANGITPKAHCLNYDPWSPDWVRGAVPAQEIKRLLDKRFGECAEWFAKDIPGWEVTNETMCNNGSATSFYMEDDFVRWSFDCAERHFPMNELIINEATEHVWGDAHDYFKGNRNKYLEQCRLEIEHGAPIDAIGMQFHMFFRAEDELAKASYFYNPVTLYQVMDSYAKLGKPLQITEVTIPAYSWEPEDEEIQAEILKNLYSIWFSHPAMEAIIYWNLVDGYAAFAPQGDMASGENYYAGGLVRFDMTKKPAYYALRDLFTKTWHTETVTGTNDEGVAAFNGFFGKYDLEITVDGKTIRRDIHFAKDGVRHLVVRL